MYNNTTSRHATHFLRGTELVEKATIDFKLPNENWPFPTQYRFGIPMDKYYSEIWCNGMDWQNTYWALEEINYEEPTIQPLIWFEDSGEEEIFNPYDFGMLVMACLYYRRDKFFIKQKDYGMYTDMVWPFLKFVDEDEPRFTFLKEVIFSHANQPEVTFWINPEFIPTYVFERGKNDNNRSDRNSTPGFSRSVEKGKGKIIRLV